MGWMGNRTGSERGEEEKNLCRESKPDSSVVLLTA
jgi:hypothetical protein